MVNTCKYWTFPSCFIIVTFVSSHQRQAASQTLAVAVNVTKSWEDLSARNGFTHQTISNGSCLESVDKYTPTLIFNETLAESIMVLSYLSTVDPLACTYKTTEPSSYIVMWAVYFPLCTWIFSIIKKTIWMVKPVPPRKRSREYTKIKVDGAKSHWVWLMVPVMNFSNKLYWFQPLW